MHNKSVAELSRELESGKISSVELTREFLDRIKAEDDQYNSFITVTEDLAMADAKAADEQRAAGNASVWTGVPFAHKDIFCTNGVATTAGSKMLADFVPPYDATVVANFRAAGAVCLGKTNMDEFAMGSSTESSFFGPATNPWGLNKGERRVPGGSSGGSAAAIAARLVPAATATDTGGSIRQPAALCGVTGLKPTYGRVSRYGMIAFASSLDQGGTMARTAEDNALMLNVMAGFDPKDSTSADRAVQDYTVTLNQPLKGLRVGLPKEYFSDQLNPAMEQQVRNAVKEYEKLGATVKEVSLPHAELAIAAYYVIAPAEASANLSRFDGVRYGYRCDNPQDLNDLYTRTRAEGFGNEVKRRILVGTYALSAGYFDAYYLKAQKVRRLIQQDFINAFKDVDVLMSPVSPSPAFIQGEKTSDPVTMYLEDIFTIAVNLAGVPAMSVPAGFVGGLPVGLQIIGNYFEEARLLNAAHQFQQVTDWHQKLPQ
ncbi:MULTISPECIES: Asp-tRNA(Asn)/Glu-tRNA(Gln) amidotransferase subunit GatA [unclassified Marinobacter]|jgi:aspartyl-tRNA(Asn)/glutamyl-tRNA(Gln) amidotransferase subunit A|uniref:Asp-tRNA(Asn)/Glu-tRNA(Gln) amidotransferase subunit GatA n=1 Tax=unclassified Marinobacter TaxID=83889 RepID=UPI00200D3BB1|nr:MULTISPECIES: Asp-tRNA(Asn)/Glu-tRNA(Gln) amidotransferase subunit GatA [unclassified Marinobacter]UQG54688.1 Asp-tRNA(Asn)/Glu-tRNA(Gln) amidotransferase subunit GatA [Marinobacter sp. M4C]UQG63490.1 Asp-tRNA(Asn)/Glu-tRNA(Gln) amidotransferase subunit GatA [Marinobacter sp. M2C]UQG67773.1 Asp-tRNA(Asn)/Glu-tRNA(Gln) amidotransferase subunit GatA [Marinobacter sp. M1C]